jgi:hypothetical protein
MYKNRNPVTERSLCSRLLFFPYYSSLSSLQMANLTPASSAIATNNLESVTRSEIMPRVVPISGLGAIGSPAAIRNDSMTLSTAVGTPGAGPLTRSLIAPLLTPQSTRRAMPFPVDNSEATVNIPIHINRIAVAPKIGTYSFDVPAIGEPSFTKTRGPVKIKARHQLMHGGIPTGPKRPTVMAERNLDTRQLIDTEANQPNVLDTQAYEAYSITSLNTVLGLEEKRVLDEIASDPTTNDAEKLTLLLKHYETDTPLKVMQPYTFDGVVKIASTLHGSESTAVNGGYGKGLNGLRVGAPSVVMTLIERGRVDMKDYTLGRGISEGGRLSFVIRRFQYKDRRAMYVPTSSLGVARNGGPILVEAPTGFPFAPVQIAMVATPDGSFPSKDYGLYRINIPPIGGSTAEVTERFYDGIVSYLGRALFAPQRPMAHGRMLKSAPATNADLMAPIDSIEMSNSQGQGPLTVILDSSM